jgi:hypothetical protein
MHFIEETRMNACTNQWFLTYEEHHIARLAALNARRAAKRAASPVASFPPASTGSPPPLPPSSRPAFGTSTLTQRSITAATSCPGYHHVTVACACVSGREECIKSMRESDAKGTRSVECRRKGTYDHHVEPHQHEPLDPVRLRVAGNIVHEEARAE